MLTATSSNKKTSTNQNASKKKNSAAEGQKQLDNAVTLTTSSTSNKSTVILATISIKHTDSRRAQKEDMNTETMRRFGSLINGPHSAAFCKKMDILSTGYGKLDVDKEILFVKIIVLRK